VWTGERLGVRDLSIAVAFVFGVRIFQNLAAIRRHLFHA
jgi:small basic protein